MKNLLKIVMYSFVGVLILSSCKKQIDNVSYLGGENPKLTASNTSNIVLLKANENIVWNTFTWTNPNYKFSTGISSQDVTYTMQFDTTGANFTNPNIQEISISKELSKEFTVKDINTILAKMNLLENVSHNMEVRLKSTLSNSTLPLYSSVIKFIITPYLDVVYPVPAALWITGSATPLNWQCGCATDVGTTQKFTKVSSTKFELTIALSANNSYLLLPQYGSWSAKYGFNGSNNNNDPTGGEFKPDGGDMKAPSTSGTYKITVEFKTGKWTVS